MSRFRTICYIFLLFGAPIFILIRWNVTHRFSYVGNSNEAFEKLGILGRSTLDPATLLHVRNIVKAHKNFTFYKVEPGDLFIFSAYHDQRYDRLIRFVGMAVHQKVTDLKCLILNEDKLEVSRARIHYLPEGHNLKFDAIYVLCHSASRLEPGVSVGLSFGPQYKPFFIPLHTIPSAPILPSNGLIVCYPPLHNDFNDVHQFVENIELNRLLGFRRFFIYVHKVGEKVRRAIQDYERDGIIDVISWEKFPLVSGATYPAPGDYAIHYLGQMVAINDCLYRAMNQPYRIVAFHDFDELILPHVAGKSLLDLANREMVPNVSGLSVRCGKFSVLYPNDPTTSNDKTVLALKLTTQLKSKRVEKLVPHRERSKMLVAAENVLTMGIHFVWKYRQFREKNLTPSVALLHHYRSWGKPQETVVDRTAFRYKTELVKNVKQRFKRLVT